MSIGGKVVQVFKAPDKIWVNAHDNGEYTAIFVEPFEGPEIQLGDTIWWQQGRAHWTQDGITRELKKVGCSGVNHPLGTEFQVKYDWKKIATQRREKLTKLREVLESIDNMSACGPFAPDPRDLVRAIGERAQEALKKK